MSDPLRTDGPRVQDAATDPVERDAKIEQLLLVGLDQYFAGEYDQAINVWTRALFLDRNHARARAYIERARGALAERQRQSEELLHCGIAALHRGESDEARRLLQAAIDGGVPLEDAGPALERLNRLQATMSPPPPPPLARERRTASPGVKDSTRPRSGTALAASVLLLIVAAAGGAYVAASWDVVGSWRAWLPLSSVRPATVTPRVTREVMLEPPTRGQRALARARALAASGHLHDALSVLDRIWLADPLKGEADRLRADIQRQLLGLERLP